MVAACYALVMFDQGEPGEALRTLGLAFVDVAPDGALDGFESALKSKFRGVTSRLAKW